MTRIYLSIGSNVERESNLRSGVRQLDDQFRLLILSSVYQTGAVGFEGEDFLNMAVGFDSDLPVEQLQGRIKAIEDVHGRARGLGKYISRPLDIDLLLYGDMIRHDDSIDVPRREILHHAFVLQPLSEIAPTRKHPETGLTYGESWRAFDASRQSIRRIEFSFGS